MNYDKVMKQARKRIAMMQQIERRYGNTAEEDGTDELIRTVMFAIESGISTDSWECVAEAMAMLETVADRIGIPWNGNRHDRPAAGPPTPPPSDILDGAAEMLAKMLPIQSRHAKRRG